MKFANATNLNRKSGRAKRADDKKERVVARKGRFLNRALIRAAIFTA
jgi:hypothetical protein